MEHIVIIGNGISGVTLARHVRKLSDKKITIVSAETDYFFSRTALMYVYWFSFGKLGFSQENLNAAKESRWFPKKTLDFL